jgi:hypothetical protein
MGKKSTINISNIKGNVRLNQVKGNMNQAGVDIVKGNKTTNADNNIFNGFKQENDKQQFIVELEKLRTVMRDMRNEIIAIDCENEDDKDEIFSALIAQINALKQAKQQVEEIPIGEQATTEQTHSIQDYIESTHEIIERAQTFGETMEDLTMKLTPLIAAAQPMLMTIKSLFGF